VHRRMAAEETQDNAHLHGNIGVARQKLGDTTGALQAYAEARRLHELTGTLDTVDGRRLLANIRISQRRQAAGGLEAFKAAVPLEEKEIRQALVQEAPVVRSAVLLAVGKVTIDTSVVSV